MTVARPWARPVTTSFPSLLADFRVAAFVQSPRESGQDAMSPDSRDRPVLAVESTLPRTCVDSFNCRDIAPTSFRQINRASSHAWNVNADNLGSSPFPLTFHWSRCPIQKDFSAAAVRPRSPGTRAATVSRILRAQSLPVRRSKPGQYPRSQSDPRPGTIEFRKSAAGRKDKTTRIESRHRTSARTSLIWEPWPLGMRYELYHASTHVTAITNA